VSGENADHRGSSADHRRLAARAGPAHRGSPLQPQRFLSWERPRSAARCEEASFTRRDQRWSAFILRW